MFALDPEGREGRHPGVGVVLGRAVVIEKICGQYPVRCMYASVATSTLHLLATQMLQMHRTAPRDEIEERLIVKPFQLREVHAIARPDRTKGAPAN